MSTEPEAIDEEFEFEPINDLLDYLIDGEYDDYRDGYLYATPEGTNGSGDYYYTVAFSRSTEAGVIPLQEWFVTVSEQS